MKKIELIILSALAVTVLSGCTFLGYTLENGNIHSSLTNRDYDVQNSSEKLYEVIKGGVRVLMTQGEIEKYHLDTADDVIIKLHKISKKNVIGASELDQNIK